jgi:phytoene synthase
LPITPFISLIQSRQFDLYDDPMPTLGDPQVYLGETSSAILQLGAMILTGSEATRLAEAAGLAGVAYGLTGLLRTLPVHRARGQCFVPKDLLAKHGLTPAQWLSAREGQKAAMVVTELCDQAAERLRQAREAASPGPGASLPAFLPASLTDLYLDRVRKLGGRALTVEAEVPQWRRQLTLYLKAKKNVF